MRQHVLGCAAALMVSFAAYANGIALRTHPIGFNLPEGFDATVFAEGIDLLRDYAVSSDGVVFVIQHERIAEGGFLSPRLGIVALKDDDGDGVADRRERFGEFRGLSIRVWRDPEGVEWLYAASLYEVRRWRLAEGELAPGARSQRIVHGFRKQREHKRKAIAISEDGDLFVMIGAPTNNCMVEHRTPGSPGRDPCPDLEWAAGVWRFDAATPDQHVRTGDHFATGVRNSFAFKWSTAHQALYGVQHGRDHLHRFWPDIYSVEESAELPSEEFYRIERGDNFGWPYAYYDHIAGARMVSPEYGGDGQTIDERFTDPLIGFPGHWAPAGLAFYEGVEGFPERYHDGAFITFKGGWNRAPLAQAGFRIVFVPMAAGVPSGPPRGVRRRF